MENPRGMENSEGAGKRLFCFGLGYSALALIDRLRRLDGAANWQFSGTSRSPLKCAELSRQGIRMQVFDGKAPLAEPALLHQASHVLISVPAEGLADGDPVLRLHGADLAARPGLAWPGLAWIGYLSTTGVYGDHQGGWVDETMPMTPSQERGRRRAAAEAAWFALGARHGLPVHSFRLAGIYGPGRNALENLRQGKAHRIVKPGQYFSRIHVEDIAQVLQASMQRPNPGAAYNLADDEPAPPQDVVLHAAGLLGLEPPPEVPFDAAEMTPMARSFYAENKRVANQRIKQELGVALLYPTYREGLAALLKS